MSDSLYVYGILANRGLLLQWGVNSMYLSFLFHNALQCEVFIACGSWQSKAEPPPPLLARILENNFFMVVKQSTPEGWKEKKSRLAASLRNRHYQ